MQLHNTKILNIDVNNITSEELLSTFDEGFLVTPNVDHMIKLQKMRPFYEAYQSAEFKVCDSRILFLLVWLLFPSRKLKEQITGSDFFPKFCQHHANRENGATVFLLGGSTDSVVEAQTKINDKTDSNVVVGGYSPPFGFEKSPEETQKIIDLIEASGADTLAIGVGAPKQEVWVYQNRAKLPSIKRFLAIGATIEFESENLRRAPKWMTKCGLEWLFRLQQEPRRLSRRYLIDDLPIAFLLLKQKLGFYSNPWR